MSDEIKQAIEALKKCDQAFGIMSDSARHSGLEGTKEWDTIAGSADMYGAQDAAREAATALERLPGRVTAKALEWEECAWNDGVKGRTDPFKWKAEAVGLTYRVMKSNGTFAMCVAGQDAWAFNFNNETEAFAAAQADFEARILAAIDTAPAQNQAAFDVIAERRRQVEQEGWTPEHDDTHTRGEMAGGAACYALYRSHVSPEEIMGEDILKMSWPWDASWWKPKDRRRDLVRAGALIIAEIERLDRALITGGDDGR